MESPSRLALKDVEMVSKGEKETVTSSRTSTFCMNIIFSRIALAMHRVWNAKIV